MSDKNVITGNVQMVNVTSENAEKETFFCIKDIKSAGFKSKQRWFE